MLLLFYSFKYFNWIFFGSSDTINNEANSLLVIFEYNENCYSTRLTTASSLFGVKSEICDVWPHLNRFSIEISYVLENKTIVIDTDSDLLSILCLLTFKKSQYFKFTVKENVGVMESDSNGCGLGSESIQSTSIGSNSGTNCESHADSSHYLKDMLKKGSQKNIADFLGFCFNGAEDFREFLMAYQIKYGYALIFVRNAPDRISVNCSWINDGCKFYVNASSDPGLLSRFFIRTYNFNHSCGAGLRDVNKVTISSRFVKSLILDQIRDAPMKKSKDIIAEFRREYNFNLSYYYAYSGKQLALKEIYGDDAMSYNDLRWYSEALQQYNPGSYVSMDVDSSTNQFERICLAFGACLLGFKHCRPLIFLDAAHLKGRPGVLLAATSKNANQGTSLILLLFSFSWLFLYL